MQLHGRQARSVRWDNHVCLPFNINRRKFFSDLERHRSSGFNIVSVNIGYADATWDDHIGFADELRGWIAENDETFMLVADLRDIQVAKSTNRLGILFDVEGANLLDGDVGRIQMLYDRGVRWMCLTYNLTNALVGGCGPDAVDSGLTNLGRAVVREMNNVGMTICCSHTGSRSALEIIELSERPVIFSHSNSLKLHRHWRNISDETAVACANKGGVICVNGVAPFLDTPPYDDLVNKLVEQINYLVGLLGADHVGLGLDYVYDQSDLDDVVESQRELFGGPSHDLPAFDFIPPEALADVENRLIAHGLEPLDIDKVLGGNLVRIGTDCWHSSH